MVSHVDQPMRPVTPSDRDTELARDASRRLARLLASPAHSSLRISGGGDEPIALPESAVRLLAEILEQMAAGHALSLIPVHAELTTQQAADFLNVSRPFLIKLLDRGEMPCRRVGRHRRVRFEDLLRFKDRADEERRAALRDLVADGEDLGMDD